MSIYDIATLADQLAELYPSVEEARRVLTETQFNTIEIEFSNRPRDNWWNILQAAAYKKGALNNLLAFVVKEFPGSKLIEDILHELEASDQPEANADDTHITTKEKVERAFEEFKDTVDLHTGSKGGLNFPDLKAKRTEWFHQITGLSKAVGVIRSPDATTSAILLKDGYVLTTFLNATLESISDIHLFLQYDENYDELNRTEEVALDPVFFRNNKALHYTLLRRREGEHYFYLSMPVTDIDSLVSKDISVISHPSDMNKRINGGKIIRRDGAQLIYRTREMKDSPGGPVVNQSSVVAMHTGLVNQDKKAQSLKFGMMITDILLDAGLPLNTFTDETDQ
ncbi:MAG: effector-associated domain EAD1-containing protein [Bacteroidota bacterium]|nr:effector-associated domain EAD1-containing protein [Bacteroidota bacterium]